MRSPFISFLVSAVLIFTSANSFAAPTLPPSDQRAGSVKDLNTPRTFPKIESRTEWQARAKEIRDLWIVGLEATGARSFQIYSDIPSALDHFEEKTK